MPLRSVFAIDVDASAFNEFQKTFDKYQTALNSLPNAWAKVNAAATASKDNFIGMAAALMAQSEMLHKSQIEAEKLKNHANATNLAFTGLVRTTAGVAHNIAEATKSLLSWTGVVSVLGGLIGAGGLFGIERLAGNASNIRKEAMGMGLSNQYTNAAPEMQAFGVYGRILNNPQAFLHGVNQILNSSEGVATLMGAGLQPGQWRGRSTTSVATALLPHIRSIAQRAPENQLQDTLNSAQLGGLVTVEEAKRLRDMSDAEFGHLQQRQQKYASENPLNDDVLTKWQDLKLVLDQAGNKIEASLIRGLEKLTPGIERLSDAVSDFIAHILEDKDLPDFLNQVSEGLKWLGDTITSDEFKQGAKEFVHNLVELAKEVGHLVSWLAHKFGTEEDKKAADADANEPGFGGMALGGAAGAYVGGRLGGLPGAVIGGVAGASAVGIAQSQRQLRRGGFTVDPMSGALIPLPDEAGGRSGAGRSMLGGQSSATGEGHVVSQAQRIAFARQYAASKGLNPDAIVATMGGEGLNRYVGDHGTSFGDFQLHVGGGMGDQALASGINIRDPHTWEAQTRFSIDQMVANKAGGPAWYASQWHGAPGWAANSFAIPRAGGGVPSTARPGGGDAWLNQNAPFPTLAQPNQGRKPAFTTKDETASMKPDKDSYGPGSPFGLKEGDPYTGTTPLRINIPPPRIPGAVHTSSNNPPPQNIHSAGVGAPIVVSLQFHDNTGGGPVISSSQTASV